jgi:hypothetical protein
MPIKTKPINVIAEKYVRKAQTAGPDYEAGVKDPKRDWATATSGASDSYIAGVTAAIGQGRFQSGVNKAGTQKWQAKALAKGVSRYPTGVAAAKNDYQTGFSPYLSTIQGIDLPPRGPKGDPGNYNRVTVIGQALHAQKVGS